MKLTEQIQESKTKIAELEFNLAVERAVLVRLNNINNGDQTATFDKSRPIIADSIVPHIQKVLLERGRSMKVAQLVRVIQQQGIQFEGKTDPKRLVSSALIRRKDLFKRVSRGLYKLKSEKGTKE